MAALAAPDSVSILRRPVQAREDLSAREFDEELFTREFDEALFTREFDNELLARADFDKELLTRADFVEELLSRTYDPHRLNIFWKPRPRTQPTANPREDTFDLWERMDIDDLE